MASHRIQNGVSRAPLDPPTPARLRGLTQRPWAIPVALLMMLALPPPHATASSAVSYAALDTVLVRHLRDGQVDYGALARDPGPLQRFLAATREAHPEAWPRDEQIAFWANVYNARVLEGVIRRPGLKSVLDVGKTLGVPTLGFFREQSRSGGRKLSLNDIEHEILRKGFHEPRIHFVLNCASVSCPPLPARALTSAALDDALEAATIAFLLDPSRNRIAAGGDLELSSIFKWYRSDFESAAGSVQVFVQTHWKGAGAIRPDAPVRFLDYDWALNGQW